jgi:hypothetical protein
MTRQGWLWVGLLLIGPAVAGAQQQTIGGQPEVSNMKLLGWSDLQARSAYQPTIHKQGERFIAYVGHHGGTDDIPTPVNPMTGQAEPNGTSIVDVTDPAQPKYLRHIPGAPASTRMAARRWCGCATAPRCRGATSRRSTCCGPSAGRRTRSGTSSIRRTPSC